MSENNNDTNKKMGSKTFKKNPIHGTKYTIAISSAKGGVGKSTFASNIALALKKMGCKVGIMDAYIYGPSLQNLFCEVCEKSGGWIKGQDLGQVIISESLILKTLI